MGTSHPFPAQVLIMLTLSSDVFEKIQRVSYSVYLVSFVNLASPPAPPDSARSQP